MDNGSIGAFIKGIWQLFLDFIGFLFDIDFKDEDEAENPFSNVPNSATLKDKNKIFAPEDEEILEKAFGQYTARYINRLRDEADHIVNEHNFKRVDSILTVLPPEKFSGIDLAPAVISNIIESIYGQFDGDVILRPGKVNVFVNDSGTRFAEIYIDCYKLVEELVRN